MRSTINYLSCAGAGALLLACAALPPPLASLRPGPAAAPAADGAGADGYYALGRQQHAARRYTEALRSYRQALRLAPRHVNARNGLAVLHAEQGEYQLALPIWQDMTADAAGLPGPDAAFLFSNLGYAHILRGQHGQAVTLLEKACLLDPFNARAWEHLAVALEHTGQAERARLMLKQARSLQANDLRRDYALASPSPAVATAAMARTEITPAGAALVQLRRVPAASAPSGAAPAAIRRVAIYNGNGVTGMAAALGRLVQSPALQVVRLSNMKHFAIAQSRIEYAPAQQAAAQALAARLGLDLVAPMERAGTAELRIVLGLDRRDATLLRRRYRQTPPQLQAD